MAKQMKAFHVSFSVPGKVGAVAVYVLAVGTAEAIATACMVLDDGGDDTWTLLGVRPAKPGFPIEPDVLVEFS